VRLCFVAAAVLALIVLTWLGLTWLAVTLGILSGTVFLLGGMAAGGGLGNARRFGDAPADVNTRIGVCLAASGLASYALGHDPPFPVPYRVFYGVIMALVSLVALGLSVRGLKK